MPTTTWFGRCVRRAGCLRFPNESNIIEKTVRTCVNDPCSDFFANIGTTTFPDCEGNLGTTNINILGGVTPYQFLWSDSVTSQNRMDLNGGSYKVTITDSVDCQLTLSINIPIPDCQPIITCDSFAVMATSTAPDCAGNLGTIDVTVTNGIAPIIYVWSDGDSTEDRTGLQGGNYQATITDANGCTGTIDVNLPTPSCVPVCDSFAVMATSTAPDCEGNLGTIDVAVTNGVSPIVYVWSDGDSTENRTGLLRGSYQVTITDANGCTGTIDINLPTPSCAPDCDSFAVMATSTAPDCEDNLGTIDVVVANGVSPIVYVWSDGDSTEDRTGLQGGSYQVTITDANGCTGTIDRNLPTPSCVPDCSTFSIMVTSTSPDCDGNLGTINIEVLGGIPPYKFLWSDSVTTQNRTELNGGDYNITVTDSMDCQLTLSVNIPTPDCSPLIACDSFAAMVTGATAPDCEGNLGAINLTVENGLAPIVYAWSDGDSTANRTDLQGGAYQATITDANGCTGMIEVNLPTPSCEFDCTNFSAEITSTTPPDCDGNLGTIDIAVINGDGPVRYQWMDGDTTQDWTNLTGGFYQVTITHTLGCEVMLTVGIPTPSCETDCNAFIAQVVETTMPDCAGDLGSIEVAFINGLAPITYQWADDSTRTTAIRTGLVGGDYAVTLTDVNGCTDNLNINIATPNCTAQCDLFDVKIDSVIAPDCEGNLGSILLSVENGVAPLTYTWQDGSSIEDRDSLPGGSYKVTVSDGNACFEVVEIAVPTPNCEGAICDNFIIPFTVVDVTCDGNNGRINLSAFGGTAPYQYEWADIEENIEDRNNLAIGTYEVTVIDAVGCKDSTMITVGTGDCVTTLTPFDCPSFLYQIVEGQLNQLDIANDSLIPLGEEANNLNPLGYNVEDNFIYGIRFGTTDLIRIGKNGNREVVGRIQGINVGLLSGDFDLEGNYYLLDNDAQRLQRVDISATILVAATIELSDSIPALGDVAYHPIDKLLYGVSEAGEVVSIDPITGTVNSFKINNLPAGSAASSWMTNKGELIISYNVSQEIYHINLTDSTAVLIGNTGDSALNADGANCSQASSPLDSLLNQPAFAFRSIQGDMTDEMVMINYEVVNEAPDAFYLLEYSVDGNQFETLPGLEYALGVVNHQYEIMDQNPKLGSGYYRVKYVAIGGAYAYSDVLPVLFKQADMPNIMVHPNPFTNQLTINFLEPLAQDAKIMIANNLGVIMETCSAEKGTNRLFIDCPNYTSGVYMIHVKVKGRRSIVYRTIKVE